MSAVSHTNVESRLIACQMGRPPREPWAVIARCGFGHPSAIVSPPVLDDGTPFPTWAWLTCPHLADAVSAQESAGATARWATRLAAEPELAAAVLAADAELRAVRGLAGEDPHPEVGIAGQRDPLATKCLHSHVALALAGIADPIGDEVIRCAGVDCAHDRCGSLLIEICPEAVTGECG